MPFYAIRLTIMDGKVKHYGQLGSRCFCSTYGMLFQGLPHIATNASNTRFYHRVNKRHILYRSIQHTPIMAKKTCCGKREEHQKPKGKSSSSSTLSPSSEDSSVSSRLSNSSGSRISRPAGTSILKSSGTSSGAKFLS